MTGAAAGAAGAARPVDVVLGRVEGARRSGESWMGRCPHHDDRQASLSVREGIDGRALIHCHRGCPTVDVVADLGLAMVDLFPPGSRERRRPRTWGGGIVPIAPHGRPALAAMGDDVLAAMLDEVHRLAEERGRLTSGVTGAISVLRGALLGVG